MKYMLLIYGNEDIWTSFTPDEMGELVRATDAHNTAMFASGEMISVYGVLDQDQAKQVSTRDGAPVVTDGPYIEAKEYIGSFAIIDVDSFERAVEIAAANPASKFTPIEIRPLMSEAAEDM